MTLRTQRRKNEGGFALLLVFLLAAAVAFTLYQQLPRVAFESVRNKEQVLMDRGNQYKRAIEVFYAVNKRYPAKIEDLENTNNKRFLRRRYKDPMTGSDEWRLVHTNGSFLTDSLVQKPPAQNASNGQPANGQLPGAGPLGTNTMNTTGTAGGTTVADNAVPGTPAPVNPAVLRRPSDRLLPQDNSGVQQAFNPQSNPQAFDSQAYDSNDPRTFPPITLTPPNQQQNPLTGITPGQSLQQSLQQAQQQGNGVFVPPGFGVQQGQPVQQQIQQVQQGQQQPNTPFVLPGFGGQVNAQTAIQSAFGSNIPGQLPGQRGLNPQPNNFGNGINNQVTIGPDGTLVPANPFPGQQQQPFQPQPFQQPQTQQPAPTAVPQPQLPNQALQAINDQLLRPNQGQVVPGNGTQGSPGIAGVATNFKGPSIKSYREHSKYEEWEFVFLPAAVTPPQTQTPQQQNPGQQPNPALQTPGQPPMQNPMPR